LLEVKVLFYVMVRKSVQWPNYVIFYAVFDIQF